MTKNRKLTPPIPNAPILRRANRRRSELVDNVIAMLIATGITASIFVAIAGLTYLLGGTVLAFIQANIIAMFSFLLFSLFDVG